MWIEIDWRPEAGTLPDQFQKMIRELDDVVFSAPGVMIAGPQFKAQPLVEGSLLAEIAGRMDDMVNGARHGLVLRFFRRLAPVAVTTKP